MKKILCIANDIGYSAAGVVFETIVQELQKTCQVYIISPHVSDAVANRENLTILPTARAYDVPWRITRLSAVLLGLNFADYIESKMQQKQMCVSELSEFDCILSFVAQQKYFGLLLGRDLARQLNVKWVVYSVDAIPVPDNWGLNSMMRKSMGRTFRRLIEECDLFLLSNPYMLKYQIDTMPHFHGKYGVVYTPSRSSVQTVECHNSDGPVFLYTGGVYRLRRMNVLIQAFRRLVADKPTAKIIFVGNSSLKEFDAYKELVLAGNIEIHGFVKDLSIFYERATALLDLNADISNDVFLSSKIVNYLPINKPILCISGDNSPARNIFLEDASIVHCGYDAEDIYNAMCCIVSLKSIPQNRAKYVEMFSAQYAVKTLVAAIEKLS